MRFFVTGEQYRNRLLRVIVGLFLAYAVLHWLTNALMYFQHMGLSAESVAAYYLGSEEKMIPPRSFQGMLEVAHFHLFAMGIFALTLVHLVMFVPLGVRFKTALIAANFGGAFLQEGSGWLVRFVHPALAPLKPISFILLQVSLGAVIVVALHAVLRRPPSGYKEGRSAHEEALRAGG
jgi:hypothetical protein